MKKFQRGMTMLEVAVWIGLFVFALGAITSSIIYFYRTNSYAIEQGTATISAQRGIEEIVKVAREVSYASDGAYPIISMAANQLALYADIDSDPYIERVRYYVAASGGDEYLYRGVINPSGDPLSYSQAETISIVTDHVRNLAQGTSLFSYYDADGAPITDLTQIDDVRFVTVNLVVDVNPLKSPTVLTLRSSAGLRNLR